MQVVRIWTRPGYRANEVVEAKTSAAVILDENLMAELLALWSRSDDPAIRFEIARIFVSITRTLSRQNRDNRRNEAVSRVEQRDVIDIITYALLNGRKYPIVTNECVMALALTSARGQAGISEFRYLSLLKSDSVILHSLRAVSQMSTGEENDIGRDGIQELISILIPEPSEPDPAPEIQTNIRSLLEALHLRGGDEVGRLRHSVVEAVKLAQADGRPLDPATLTFAERWATYE